MLGQIVGVALIATLVGGLVAWSVVTDGWRMALGGWAFSFSFVALFYVAALLATGELA